MPDLPKDAATVPSIDAENLVHAADCLIAQAERYFIDGALASALPCLTEAMKLRKQTGDDAGHAQLAQTVGFLCFQLRDHDGALSAYETALAYRLAVEDQRGQAVTLGRLAEVHQHQGNHLHAIRLLLASLALFSEDTGLKDIGTTLNNLCMSYCETNQLGDAMTCFEKSLVIRRQVNDLDGLAATLLNLSLLHAEKGSFALAAEALSEARDIHDIAGDKLGLCRTTLRLGMLHYDMGDYGVARHHFVTSLALATDSDVASEDDEAAALCNLGDLALREGDFSDAQPMLERAERILAKSGLNVGLGMVRYGLGRLYALMGQPSVALAYLTEAKMIQESGDDLGRLSGTLVGIGVVLSNMGKQPEAITHFKKAHAIQHAMRLHEAGAHTTQWLMHATALLQQEVAGQESVIADADAAAQVAIEQQSGGASLRVKRPGDRYRMPGSHDFECSALPRARRTALSLH